MCGHTAYKNRRFYWYQKPTHAPTANWEILFYHEGRLRHHWRDVHPCSEFGPGRDTNADLEAVSFLLIPEVWMLWQASFAMPLRLGNSPSSLAGGLMAREGPGPCHALCLALTTGAKRCSGPPQPQRSALSHTTAPTLSERRACVAPALWSITGTVSICHPVE